MKIDLIYDLIDKDLITDKFDKSISENILQAETDWDTEIESLEEFIIILEEEIKGETTLENLEALLLFYNQNLKNNTWKSESLCSLIEIFKCTGFNTLKRVFENLSINLADKLSLLKIEVFEKKGYPTLKVYENYFEIKAIDYSEFRRFEFSNLKKIAIEDIKEKWWYKLYTLSSLAAQVYAKDDPVLLIIINKNNGIREYKTSNKTNLNFKEIISLINSKITP